MLLLGKHRSLFWRLGGRQQDGEESIPPERTPEAKIMHTTLPGEGSTEGTWLSEIMFQRYRFALSYVVAGLGYQYIFFTTGLLLCVFFPV